MGKANTKSDADEDLDLFEDGEELESDLDLELLGDADDEELPKLNGASAARGSSRKASAKLETKRRLYAYLERKWFRDHGWGDDDELFNDEFFAESSNPIHHHA